MSNKSLRKRRKKTHRRRKRINSKRLRKKRHTRRRRHTRKRNRYRGAHIGPTNLEEINLMRKVFSVIAGGREGSAGLSGVTKTTDWEKGATNKTGDLRILNYEVGFVVMHFFPQPGEQTSNIWRNFSPMMIDAERESEGPHHDPEHTEGVTMWGFWKVLTNGPNPKLIPEYGVGYPSWRQLFKRVAMSIIDKEEANLKAMSRIPTRNIAQEDRRALQRLEKKWATSVKGGGRMGHNEQHGGASQEDMRYVFGKIDTNGDGKISRREMDLAIGEWVNNPNYVEEEDNIDYPIDFHNFSSINDGFNPYLAGLGNDYDNRGKSWQKADGTRILGNDSMDRIFKAIIKRRDETPEERQQRWDDEDADWGRP